MKIKAFLFLLFFSNLLYGSKDLVELYRLGGIEQVQNELDKRLTNKDYWLNYLKDKDISKGYYESINQIIVCKKDLKNMKLFGKNNGKFKEQLSGEIIIGEGVGDKQKEGDLKTPVGTYELTNILQGKKLDPFYGPLAYVTSYPNAYDRLKNKDGHGIWIHGLPLDGKRDPYTKGCIALENNKIENLYKKLKFKNTILMIQEDGEINVDKEDISTVLSQVYQWRDSWKNSDFDKYISFYSNEFKKYDGMKISAFISYKKRLFKKKDKKSIKFSDINVMPYPNVQNKKLFKVSMKQKYQSKYYKSSDIKELYLELKDNKMVILTES